MTRRARTLLVGGVLFLVLFVVVVAVPVPYVVLSPGPTLNTLADDDTGKPIISISGTTVQKTTGNLNLTTVDVSSDRITAFQALVGWLRGDESVVPRASIFPPGQSTSQVNQQNTQDFTDSQDSATAAAFCELGYPFGVTGVPAGGAAAGHLQAGDVLLALDGTPTTTQAALQAALGKDHAGQRVTVQVRRADSVTAVPITLGAVNATTKLPTIGIEIGCVGAAKVTLGLGNEIGGPSAGMMFALGIIDKLGHQDLTGGRFIAGTGTIDPSGTVGPIGGIQLKMIAARRKGATVFLAPAGNCPDVLGAIPKGLDVVRVSTLHEAVTDLETIKTGGSVQHC